jgi:hypothetical protein
MIWKQLGVNGGAKFQFSCRRPAGVNGWCAGSYLLFGSAAPTGYVISLRRRTLEYLEELRHETPGRARNGLFGLGSKMKSAMIAEDG